MSVIYREDRGKWQVSYLDPVTKKRRRVLRPTKRLALELEQSFLMPQVESTAIKKPIEDAIKDYFELFSKAKDSLCVDRRCLRVFAYFFVTKDVLNKGYAYIHQVKLEDLQKLQRWLQCKQTFEPLTGPNGEPVLMKPLPGLKNSTINRWFDTYKNLFKECLAWQCLSKNPCDGLSDLPVDEFLRDAVKRDAFEAALRESPEWFKPVFEFLYIYGCRPSSIERLQVSHVNFETKEFRLSTKKGKSRSLRFFSLPITDRAEDILRDACRAKRITDHVFTDNRGAKINAGRISKEASKAFKRCGLPHTAYSLRNSIVEDALTRGVPMEQVRRLVGHASIETTQGYARQMGTGVVGESLRLVRN